MFYLIPILLYRFLYSIVYSVPKFETLNFSIKILDYMMQCYTMKYEMLLGKSYINHLWRKHS